MRDDVLTDPGVRAAIVERGGRPKSSPERAHLEAEKIFINVGARARVPDMPGLSEVDYQFYETNS